MLFPRWDLCVSPIVKISNTFVADLKRIVALGELISNDEGGY
ncbi:hypothetical protein SAMN04488101_101288 [Pedobacter nyackensis]|uniref:Uncharacterized protein n=1 Tax=Pedobacter nyackensis TaxID=475255 RepID=A0A1W2A7I9_9SPHI|nr:hypothetical protein SAMN04488101_101288 [Pedobacter nyackensis]